MKVANDVLKVLSDADLSGSRLVLQGQLDRKMYVSVNKVLEAAGWKWDRKAKAHTCEGEAVDVLERVLLTGEVTIAKDEFQFFPTPKAVVDQLIELAAIKPGMRVLEPSAGKGAIAYACADAGAGVHCIELMEANFAALVCDLRLVNVTKDDFLNVPPHAVFDRVVMNPPFARQADIKHVMHAYKFLVDGGRLVSVMSSGVTFRDDKLTRSFRVLIRDAGGEIIELPQGSFKESGTMVNTVIAVLPK
jgi:methylase of polypeptide subunit release factors